MTSKKSNNAVPANGDEWKTERLPRLVGSKGATAILNVHKTTLNHWMEPGSGGLGPDKTYMVPPVRVGDGGDDDNGWPIWAREDVERFAKEIGRQRSPAGQAQRRTRRSAAEPAREHIAAIEAQLHAAEARIAALEAQAAGRRSQDRGA